MILADEVGLGKTYVALAVAVSLLDAIRQGKTPDGFSTKKPVVLVLTPSNNALFNKWMREAEAFKNDCAMNQNDLDWLEIRSPVKESSKSGNMVDLAREARKSTRKKPILLIAKHSVLGAALRDKEEWRRRALAIVFKVFSVQPEDRKWWCRQILGSGAKTKVPELLDLRKSSFLWEDTDAISKNLFRAFQRAANDDRMHTQIERQLSEWNADRLQESLDDLTRKALASDLPLLPLVVIDESHNLKNETVQNRKHLENLLSGRICRMLGLSATPFQLRQDELLSILKLRQTLALPNDRHEELDNSVKKLSSAMSKSRVSGDGFRQRWRKLRLCDESAIREKWESIKQCESDSQDAEANRVNPARIAYALKAALELEDLNRDLQRHLHPFIIRHQHEHSYRKHFVGRNADVGNRDGVLHFNWAPGMEVRGKDELAQYLMMRSVALAKDEKGLPGLGAELTGSYRHLVETSAVWRKLANAKNPLLQKYRVVLNSIIGNRSDDYDPDEDHRKVRATAKRALEFFKKGQKTLIFCVYTKTADAVRDQVDQEIKKFLDETQLRVFGEDKTFENFRGRFFDRRGPLFSMIQDHPLIGDVDGQRGISETLKLRASHLNKIAELLVERGEPSTVNKPDRRLLLAAAEHVAVNVWRESNEGKGWLEQVLGKCEELGERIADPIWLEAREPLSLGKGSGHELKTLDPEAGDPLNVENLESHVSSMPGVGQASKELEGWVNRLKKDAIGEVIYPYFKTGLITQRPRRLPLLVEHHGPMMASFNLATRVVAGQVFRRILMAKEFLLRYLADVERDNTERWSDYLSERYVKPPEGHFETLQERVQAYLETLVRAGKNQALLSGYQAAATNQNVVQLVKGGMERDRYFLGFNTPYRPEVLVATSVGQEGIDLHRECRHVIHHDLCWNPATIEQRTGRIDRIGSKVERERLGKNVEKQPSLEIAVPYLAATYDERMFEELYRRAQLFEVTLGGDMRVEGRIEQEHVKDEKRKREKAGIGTEDEDLGEESDDTGAVDLPKDMVERLRVDLSVWKSAPGYATDGKH
ncbi:helicase-related protein [Thalassoglobus sp.]|uniref:helicase-related protein n=1 Tax=Thalassoglobus sp. TaxID=2795869 RepID=UPI003AA98794